MNQDVECTGTLCEEIYQCMSIIHHVLKEQRRRDIYVYKKVKQQSGAPGVDYLVKVNERVTENLGMITLRM